MKTDIEIAGEYQSKFRFYFVALTFTLLAAAVQSAPLSEMSLISKVFELSGWLALLICGLVSLSYIEKSAVIYNHRGTIKRPSLSGEAKAEIEEQLSQIEKQSSIKYVVAKYSFIFGLIFEVLSRGIYGVCAS